MNNFKEWINEKGSQLIWISICEESTSKAIILKPYQKIKLEKKILELDLSLMWKLPSSFSWISLEQVMHSGAKTDEKSSSLVSSFKKHQPH